MPNGHHGVDTAWGFLAVRLHSRAFRVVAMLLIVLISLSRLALGVHFPQDVIGGILLGLTESITSVPFGSLNLIPYREVVGLVLFLLVLIFRPQGLFGAKEGG